MYCTVCYGLRKNFGLLSTIFLNFESVFLYVLLDGLVNDCEREKITFKCTANSLKKIEAEVNNQLLEYVSFINYSLVLLKIADNYRDSNNTIYKFLYYLFKKKKRYSKLRSKYNITSKINSLYDELFNLENSNSTNFDDCSKTMGSILHEIVSNYFLFNNSKADDKILILAEHIGMWIYLIDAFDDFYDDIKKNSFNPLFSFSFDIDTIEGQQKCLKSGEMMLGMMSANVARIIDKTVIFRHNEIIQNVIKYGMNAAAQKIIRKRYKRNGNGCHR